MNNLDKIVKLYKKLSKSPNLTGGRIFHHAINTIWSQRNIETGKIVKYMRTHIINDKITNTIGLLPIDITEELLSTTSASDEYRAVLRNSNDNKNNRKQLLDIWTKNILSHSVDLTALNLHGDVYTDARFKSFAWSPDETKIMYIAEKKRPCSEPFYKRKSSKDEVDSFINKGEEYNLQENWGEQYTDKYASVIAIYDLNEDDVIILNGIPENMCPAQVIWSPDGSYVVGVALETEPRKFGIIECTNRLGVIFQLDFKGSFKRISEDGKAVISPKFSPDGQYLIWLERNAKGTHHGTMRLMRTDTKDLIGDSISPKACIVVDIIQNKICITNNKSFYGLYNTSFPERCWASDNKRLLLSTIQKYVIKIYVINIVSGSITELENPELNSNLGSHQILDVFQDTLLICRQNYCCYDQCLAIKLPSEGCENNIECIEITKQNPIQELKDITYEYLDFQHENDDAITNFNCIYLGPKSNQEKQIPLIIRPHGGPHSALYNNFSLEPAVLVSLGFAVVFVNFRGSTGCGEASVKFLPGRVGVIDVEDCLLAIRKCCEKYAWLNPERLALDGGSYGGFLNHHLSGQYPDIFKAVVSRNPVIDLVSKSIVSDNSDWSAVESGSCYSQKGPVNNNLFLKSRQLSPLQHIHKIKAPTYLMLGTKDRRVPMSQGMELYFRLKANNVPIKTSIYDDNHVLNSVSVEMDRIINSVIWLLTYT